MGDLADPLVAPLGLLWSGNHHELATLTPHVGGGYTVSNIVATNPHGDCALESLLLLAAPPLIMTPIIQGYNGPMRSVIRQFRTAAAAPLVDGVVDATRDDYIDAITSAGPRCRVNGLLLAPAAAQAAKQERRSGEQARDHGHRTMLEGTTKSNG